MLGLGRCFGWAPSRTPAPAESSQVRLLGHFGGFALSPLSGSYPDEEEEEEESPGNCSQLCSLPVSNRVPPCIPPLPYVPSQEGRGDGSSLYSSPGTGEWRIPGRKGCALVSVGRAALGWGAAGEAEQGEGLRESKEVSSLSSAPPLFFKSSVALEITFCYNSYIN